MFSSFLKGKKKTMKADPLAGDINEAGKSGLNMLQGGANSLQEKFYNNPDNYIQTQIATENKLLTNAAEDASRRTRQLIAQRGMGNSSIGLGQEVNQRQELDNRLALNNASGMERLKSLYNEQMDTGKNLFNVKASQGPIRMETTKYRTGGLAPLIGAAAGGYFGGAAGAQAGAGIGQMYANS